MDISVAQISQAIFRADDAVQWIVLSIATTISIVLLAVVARVIYVFLRFLLVSLPARLRDSRELKAIISIVIAMVPLYDLTGYLVQTTSGLVSFIGGALGDFLRQSQSCGDTCAQALVRALGGTIDGFVMFLLATVSNFPVPSFLAFILLTATIYAVLNSVQPKNADARLSETLSTPGVTSLTFIGIILFSLYLSLSALLAVPLMEKQPIPANYEQADFEARITREFLSEQEFYKKYPTVDLPQAVQQSATTTEWLNAAGISGSFLDRLSLWNANRGAAHQALERRKSIAIETFRSQSALGLGGREVVSHDAALQRWAIEERGEIYRQISNCLSAAQQAVRAFTVIDATIKNNTPDRPASSGFVGAILNADNQCSINDFGTNRDAPGRANRVEGLTSFIRDWTRWLIGPESMPLVIIVGLVGFSFLGACLSRIIRRGMGEELQGLSLTDLLLVVLSGASAALMMFLASYGGLAILGDSPGNPSSYVVFALCLVAAIFSEDVWAWARIKLLGRFTDGGGEADKADDGGEKAPAETPKDKVTPQPAG